LHTTAHWGEQRDRGRRRCGDTDRRPQGDAAHGQAIIAT
jgi:hypothetical protein